ncbi:bifunctional metallophosphatase/5'-nucleotidase, partial [candidate division KSB1 bacterium]
ESLYLDAGDLMTGNPVCNMEYEGVLGGALLEMLKRCGVHAMCLGNHEFDLGADHLRDFIAASPFPILCANLREKNAAHSLSGAVYRVERNGIRIGVIGLMMDNPWGSVARAALQPFAVDSAASTAQKYIDQLDSATDLIVLLTHMGVEEDSLLAMKIHGADIIVGGHSHTRLTEEMRVNGIVIVQAGSYLKNLGVLRLRVAGDSVVSAKDTLLELMLPPNPPQSDASVLADSLELLIQTQYGKIIGDLEQAWKAGYYEGSNVGNWICDRLRERYRADVALVNAGGIRGSLNPGPVSKLDILELLPFTNNMVLFEAKGSDLFIFAAEQATAQGLHEHGALEMSGMTVDYSKTNETTKVVDVKINGKSVVPDKIYRIVSVDYVAQSQAERYLGFNPVDIQTTGDIISDVIMDEIANTKGPVRSDPNPRLREVQ